MGPANLVHGGSFTIMCEKLQSGSGEPDLATDISPNKGKDHSFEPTVTVDFSDMARI